MDSCMEISKALSAAEAVRTEFGGRGGESEAWGVPWVPSGGI